MYVMSAQNDDDELKSIQRRNFELYLCVIEMKKKHMLELIEKLGVKNEDKNKKRKK